MTLPSNDVPLPSNDVPLPPDDVPVPANHLPVPPNDVVVTAHARLHLGFLDLDGGLGRRFGGLGLGLEGPVTRLRLSRAETLEVAGPEASRAGSALERLRAAHDRPPRYRLTVEEAIPAHAGLGSGTQLALAVGRAFSEMEGLGLTSAEIAALLDRGARSGVGTVTFDQGGLVLDGGRGTATVVPPMLARMDFPDEWRVLTLLDPAVRGVSGAEEKRAFQTLPPFHASTAAHLCRLTLMRALPAVAERDLSAFGAAIEEIQTVMGRHFAPAQGGSPYTSGRVAAVLAWLQARGVTGLGQSSWGPTGFAFLPDETTAHDIMEALRRTGLAGTLCVAINKARNRGAHVLRQ